MSWDETDPSLSTHGHRAVRFSITLAWPNLGQHAQSVHFGQVSNIPPERAWTRSKTRTGLVIFVDSCTSACVDTEAIDRTIVEVLPLAGEQAPVAQPV